jgi:putative phage-type endonuclease
MKIIPYEQGSNEWLNWRRSVIGGSDSGAVLGLNQFKTEKQIWQNKVFGWDECISEKMKEGQRLEPLAREAYNKEKGMIFKPIVGQCKSIPYIGASFDGISEDLTRAVEIKCGKNYHRLAKEGKAPSYLYSQLQHQIYVADLTGIDYFSFYDGDAITMRFHRDYEFIDAMLKKYNQFWEKVTKGEWYEF